MLAQMNRWVILNEKTLPEEEAFIPVADRGFLFGEGFFTTIRVSQGHCEFYSQHIDRLKKQADAFGITFTPFPFHRIEKLIAKNGADQGIWRLKIMVTLKDMGEIGTLLVTLNPYHENLGKPGSLALFPHPLESPSAHLKTLSYLDHLLVKKYALTNGVDDAITMNHEGFLLETAFSNLFWIVQNVIYYPDFTLPYLKGIFLQNFLAHTPFPHQGIKIAFEEFPSSANVYICNSLTHIRPITSIGKRTFERNIQMEKKMQEKIASALFS